MYCLGMKNVSSFKRLPLVKGHNLEVKSIEVLLAFLNFACAFYIFLNLLDIHYLLVKLKLWRQVFHLIVTFLVNLFISHEKILVDRKNCFPLSDVITHTQPFLLPLASKRLDLYMIISNHVRQHFTSCVRWKKKNQYYAVMQFFTTTNFVMIFIVPLS